MRLAGMLIVGALLLPGAALAQQRAELMIGWLGYSDGTITQDLGIRNNALRPIENATIECLFFQDSKQLGAGAVSIPDINTNADGYGHISIRSATPPDRADCRIRSVKLVRRSTQMNSALSHGAIRHTNSSSTQQLIEEPVDLYR